MKKLRRGNNSNTKPGGQAVVLTGKGTMRFRSGQRGGPETVSPPTSPCPKVQHRYSGGRVPFEAEVHSELSKLGVDI